MTTTIIIIYTLNALTILHTNIMYQRSYNDEERRILMMVIIILLYFGIHQRRAAADKFVAPHGRSVGVGRCRSEDFYTCSGATAALH